MDEDLTASHWESVLLPLRKFDTADAPDLGEQFTGLNIFGPQNDSNNEDQESSHHLDEENDQDDESEHQSEHQNTEFALGLGFGAQSGIFPETRNQDEAEQLEELRREERQEKSTLLLNHLTQSDDPVLEAPKSPKITKSDSLFGNQESPIKLSETNGSSESSYPPPKGPLHLKNSQVVAPRSRRYSPKTVVRHLQSPTQDDPISDPLGPLGGPTNTSRDDISELQRVNKADQLVQESNAPLYNIERTQQEEQLQQSLSEHQTEHTDKLDTETSTNKDNNDLDISVGDPIKVGDITTAHIVYTIKTKNLNKESSHFPQEVETASVSRRYRDFRWIYHQLQSNHPGRIVPPPPSKQTYIGRFNENFIENRRYSLEKMLSKISKIPYFANDADFVMFLTSDNFLNDLKERERISGSGASATRNDSLDNDNTDSLSGSSGMPLVSGTSAGGFMSSLFSIPTRLPEPDEYFTKKKTYIEDLEHNLKTLYKSLELIAGQRLEIVGVIEEIAVAVDELADLEILKTTSELLDAFAQVQRKIKENLDRVNIQDNLTLGFTIEEYLRIIGSVKFILETRTKIFQQYHSFKQEYLKKQESLERLQHKYKSSIDKINLLKFEVDKLSQKTEYYENSFNSISETIKEEIDNFEMEKIKDFRNSVEIYIESAIESQKEAIELWETFYERHNLALV